MKLTSIAIAMIVVTTPAIAGHHHKGCAHTYIGTNGDDTLDESADPCDLTIKGLSGNDVIIGGSGNNVLIGGDGADDLTGGCCGNDVFQYNHLSNSRETGEALIDSIEDWDTSRDRLDFSRICATIAGGCSLVDTFTGVAGQIAYRYLEEWRCNPTCGDVYVTIVELDSTGAGWPDFGVWMYGAKFVLTDANFIL